MKNRSIVLLLFGISLFAGCGSDPLDIAPENGLTENNYWSEWGNSLNIKDFDEGSLRLMPGENGNAWIFGLKDSKPWLGLYNNTTKEKLREWNLPQNLSIDMFNSPVTLPWGYVFVAWQKPELDSSGKTKFHILQIEGDHVGEVYTTMNYSVPHIKNVGGCIYVSWDDKEMGFYPTATPEDFSKTYLLKDELVIEDAVITNMENDTTIVTAFLNDKMWIGLYLRSNNQWQDIVGKETVERDVRVSFGEKVQNAYINKFQIENLIETPWGKGFIPTYIDKNGNIFYRDIMMFDEENFHCWYARSIANSAIMRWQMREWYEGSLLVNDSIVVSPEGEHIVTLKMYKPIGTMGGYDIAPIPPQDSIKQTNSILISHTEAVSFRSMLSPGVGFFPLNWFIERYDYKKGESVWCISWTNLNEIPIRANVEGSVDTSSNPWIYNIKAEGKEYKFSVDIETGTLTPISIN